MQSQPPYVLTQEEAESVILPCLERVGSPIPGLMAACCLDGVPVRDVLMQLCLLPAWEREWRDARATLRGVCDSDVVAEVVAGLVRMYCWLKEAERDGYAEVRLSFDGGNHHCPACLARNGEVASVRVLLDRIEHGCPEFPHTVLSGDSFWVCRYPYPKPIWRAGAGGIPSSGNPEFDEFMTKLFGGG